MKEKTPSRSYSYFFQAIFRAVLLPWRFQLTILPHNLFRKTQFYSPGNFTKSFKSHKVFRGPLYNRHVFGGRRFTTVICSKPCFTPSILSKSHFTSTYSFTLATVFKVFFILLQWFLKIFFTRTISVGCVTPAMFFKGCLTPRWFRQ